MAAVGLAWGLYDSMKAQTPVAASAGGPGEPFGPGPTPGVAPVAPVVPAEVARVVRLAVSAANADGTMNEQERATVLAHAAKAGMADLAAHALDEPRPLAEIVAGVTADDERRDLYTLAYSVVRADETVTGGERIFLAQLAHALGLDVATANAIEQQTNHRIDTQ